MAETPDFEQLLAEYHAPLGRLCYFYFAGDPDAQKDLYQEISIAIWRALPGYGEKPAFARGSIAWLTMWR